MAGSELLCRASEIESGASQGGSCWGSCSLGLVESNPSFNLTAPTPGLLFGLVRAEWRGAAG